MPSWPGPVMRLCASGGLGVCMCVCVSRKAADSQLFSSWQHDGGKKTASFTVCTQWRITEQQILMSGTQLKSSPSSFVMTLQRFRDKHNKSRFYTRGTKSHLNVFWISTCTTGHNEVSALAKPFCAHKSRHNLSAYPLHLQDFGWYFRPSPGAYVRTLRIEAQRNWRLKSSCQKVSRWMLLLFLGRRDSTVM